MRNVVVAAAILGAGCGGASNVAAPSAVSSTATTFEVSGTVHDTVGRPVAQARVDVVEGPKAGVSVITDDAGRYAFDPIFDRPVVLRAAKQGYRDQSLTVAGAQAARFFRLDSARGSTSLAGAFEMIFSADAACAGIPGYARRRSYDAQSRGSGVPYVITLAGGGYDLGGNGSYFSNVLYGGVFEETAQINVNDPPIWERFPQGSHLVIHGFAQGSIGAMPATIPFSGTFIYCLQSAPGTAAPQCAVTEVSCQSSNHRLTIVRH